jgi:drug/metabolite transporter (DMT)-like permease
MPAVQAIGVRSVFATLWCGLALLASGAWRQIEGTTHPIVVLRALLEAAAAFLFFIGLAYVPFAVGAAINLSTPLFLTLLAVLVLHERVGWRRWSAVVAGFVGVLLVIQPQPGDINAWAWLILLSSLVGAVRDVLSRSIPATLPTLVVSFTTATVVAASGCAWGVAEGWQPMGWREIGLLLASSLLIAVGYQLAVLALRSRGDMSVLGSLRYASVLWAVAIGYAVWGDVPDSLAVLGIAVIVASGLFILRRQRLRAAA